MRLPRPVQRGYHAVLALVLRAAGLDFSWYADFYRNWPHALPAVEVFLQRIRPRRRSRRFLGAHPVERHAPPGSTVLDIGANVGHVSSHLLTLGYVVHAWEPDPRCVAFLSRRFARVSPGRFHLHAAAVSDYDGVATWHRGVATTESGSIIDDKPGTHASGGGEVRVQSIASVLDSVGHAALIKLDVEGAEYRVIAQLLLPENRDRFGLCIAEAHARKIPSLQAEHRRVAESIERLGLAERIMLDWR